MSMSKDANDAINEVENRVENEVKQTEPLAQNQKNFFELLMSKEADSPTDLFSTPADLLESRMAIYRGNLQAIWSKTLANAYPVLQQLVGEEFFTYLAFQYGRQYPSQSGDLNLFGDQFSDFLSLETTVKDYPYFASVANLEWNLHRAYYAENIPFISLSQFLSEVGELAQQYRLLFHPAVALFQAEYAAAQIYLAHQVQPVQTMDVALDTPCCALISRPSWQLIVTPLDNTSFLTLMALQQGQTLGDALALAIASDSQFDIANALQKWFGLGVFVGFECKE
ncbi:putative DNA-binding domain-containing protein [Undibacterium danionis]|uniref:DNA-binding domain-containing protein n=2 Tax=Undibacterium danionis TaxID=1812100 RepID=A0ABV6IFI6_9BURK